MSEYETLSNEIDELWRIEPERHYRSCKKWLSQIVTFTLTIGNDEASRLFEQLGRVHYISSINGLPLTEANIKNDLFE